MDTLIRLIAPAGKRDFVLKLILCVMVCGGIHHARDIYFQGFANAKTYMMNFTEASFMALPMCAFALYLISNLRALQLELYKKSMRDWLTGLPNRRSFMNATPEWLDADEALLIIDIDHFKRVNDRMGHEAGDLCLKKMSQHLQVVLGPYRQCARIGGEEFAVVTSGITLPQLRKIAKEISAGIAFSIKNGPQVRVTNSVGIAMHPDGQSLDDAMRAADLATYEAKALGRAQFKIRGQVA